MNTMHDQTKELILRDYIRSGKDLGSFALDNMPIYDDVCYELSMIQAESKFGKLRGTAVMESYDKIMDLIDLYQITGEYKIRVVDTQHEFFCLLAEIRDDLNRDT